MNIVPCKEGCRWQQDGMCTLSDLACPASPNGSQCRYFEQA